MIGDFLSPSIEKATYPSQLIPKLIEIGYIIDASPQLAHTNKKAFLEQLFEALEVREKLTFDLLETEEWDLFMILSNHGFCQIKNDVDLNQYLIDHGFLSFRDGARSLSDMENTSRAYSLTRGRVYLNLNGREAYDSVMSSEVEALKFEFRELFMKLKDPETNKQVIENIWDRDELYVGNHLDQSADLSIYPDHGYDLKSNIESGTVFSNSARNGTHTYEDALLYVRGKALGVQEISIIDLAPLILSQLDVPQVSYHKGQPLSV